MYQGTIKNSNSILYIRDPYLEISILSHSINQTKNPNNMVNGDLSITMKGDFYNLIPIEELVKVKTDIYFNDFLFIGSILKTINLDFNSDTSEVGFLFDYCEFGIGQNNIEWLKYNIREENINKLLKDD